MLMKLWLRLADVKRVFTEVRSGFSGVEFMLVTLPMVERGLTGCRV